MGRKKTKKISKEDENIQLQDLYDLKMKAAVAADCETTNSIKINIEDQCTFCENIECGKDRSPTGKRRFMKNKVSSRFWQCKKYFPAIQISGTDPLELEKTFDVIYNEGDFPLDLDSEDYELESLMDDPESLEL